MFWEWFTTRVGQNKIGMKDVTTQVCIAMTQYTRDHEQEALSSFSSNKVVVGFKD